MDVRRSNPDRAQRYTLDYRHDYLCRESLRRHLAPLQESMFCGKRKLRIIVPSFRKDHRTKAIKDSK